MHFGRVERLASALGLLGSLQAALQRASDFNSLLHTRLLAVHLKRSTLRIFQLLYSCLIRLSVRDSLAGGSSLERFRD